MQKREPNRVASAMAFHRCGSDLKEDHHSSKLFTTKTMVKERVRPPIRQGSRTAFRRDAESPATVRPANGKASARERAASTKRATPAAPLARSDASVLRCAVMEVNKCPGLGLGLRLVLRAEDTRCEAETKMPQAQSKRARLLKHRKSLRKEEEEEGGTEGRGDGGFRKPLQGPKASMEKARRRGFTPLRSRCCSLA